ncbi:MULTISPECIES: PAS domain-containing sensor histidine kinase [Niastella]|uniref:Oxygen sensor histidine kinase NreB n=1 Tax=Niastella soli TaxID=2821487 RepID=A0ABS3Z117_9BACT|nr:PAS domain-containing protein [Niastella soli]MBO9203457.1 PAS domain-containing protein [Niastella soli]
MRQTNRLQVKFYLAEKPKAAVQFRQVKPPANSRTIHIQRNALLDHISDAVIFTDMDLRINYVNKMTEQVFGIRLKEVTGSLFREVINYEYINDSPEQALQILQQTGSWQGKVVFTRKDNKQFYLLSTITFARNENKKPVGLIATLKDITTEELTNAAARKNKLAQQKAINQLMIKTQENERNELGRELHDNINQILAAVKLQLEYSLENYTEEKSTIERCKGNIEEVIKEIRNLSHRLVLPRFAETTLLAELQKTIDNILQQQPVYLDLHGLNEALIPDNIKETLYRIIQEQLTNIIRHAKAKKAIIKIYNTAARVFLYIEDDGIGFNPNQSRKGVGITNILNRVETYNGKATITAAPGKGCRIDVAIPLK